MPDPNQPLTVIERAITTAEQCLLHQTLPAGQLGVERSLFLLVKLRGVTWRVTCHSQLSAAKVWQVLESSGIDMEFVISLTNEFSLRMNFETVVEDVCHQIAVSLSWMSLSQSLPAEQRQFIGELAQYKDVLKANWWLVVLYLLAHSDVLSQLPIPSHGKSTRQAS